MERSLSKSTVYQIDSDETDFYNSVVKNIDHNIELRQALLNTSPTKEIASSIIGKDQFNSTYRQQLVDTIKKQYTESSIELKGESDVVKNIEKLAKDNTLTITTGQQIHIFLGPFFVVNKLLSCCAEAIKLQSLLPEYQFVPIFWLASEDHDFDEIKSARLYNETYTWDIESEGPVGRLNPKSLMPIVDQARGRIDQTEDNLAFIDICAEAYSTCKTFAQATRYIIHTLFEDTGIVVLDADDAFLKSQFSHVVQNDLFDHSVANYIDSSIQRMKNFGLKAPINTRPINFFHLSKDQRIRIEKNTDQSYSLVDGSVNFTKSQMAELIIKQPDTFSPNALLRPLYQQQVLPNVSYITGASELMYWLELKEVMTFFDITYPELPIRKSVFNISEKNIKKLESEGISIESLFTSTDRFKDIILSDQVSQFSEMEERLTKSNELLDSVINGLSDLGSIKTKKIQKYKNQLFTALFDERKTLLEELSKGNASYKQLKKVKSSLFDETYIQERNKYIIGMVAELHLSTNWFHQHPEYYSNHRIITIISS